MGGHEKVSPIRTLGLLLLLQAICTHSAVILKQANPDDYNADFIQDLVDLFDQKSALTAGLVNPRKYFADDTAILAGEPSREEESLSFYNSLDKSDLHSVANSPGEKSVRDDSVQNLALTGASHISPLPLIGNSVLPTSSRTLHHYLISPKESSAFITPQPTPTDDFTTISPAKQVLTADTNHLSIKQFRFEGNGKENENSMEVSHGTPKRAKILLSTSSSSPSIIKREDNTGGNILFSLKHLKNKRPSYLVTSKASRYNKQSKYIAEHTPSPPQSTEARKERKESKNQSNEMEGNQRSGFVGYSWEEKGNKNSGSSLQLPYRIPFPYVRRGSNEEAGREPENTDEIATDPLHPFAIGGEVVLQRRNRSKRDAPNEDTFLAQDDTAVPVVHSPQENPEIGSAGDGVREVTKEKENADGLATNVKNAPPPPPPQNPATHAMEALQRLTRLLDRMLRELSRFQQKFTLRLIRMTERQDIDQMQEIMKDFDISAEKPIFFIAGGLKKYNGTSRTSTVIANATPILTLNETERVISGLVTEAPLSSSISPVAVETTTILQRLASSYSQEATTELPVELETESATAVESESETVIVRSNENISQGDSNVGDIPVNSSRRKRSTSAFDDFHVLPIPGRSARTENPYDDFDENGWMDDTFGERNTDDKPFEERGDRHGHEENHEHEPLPASPSKVIPSNAAIDQSHILMNDEFNNSKLGYVVLGEATPEPDVPIEKAAAVPPSLAILTQAVTEDIIAPVNDSIITMREQQAERSNDHIEDQTQAGTSENIVSLNHSPPHKPQTTQELTSDFAAQTTSSLPTSEMEGAGKVEFLPDSNEPSLIKGAESVNTPVSLDSLFTDSEHVGTVSNQLSISHFTPASNIAVEGEQKPTSEQAMKVVDIENGRKKDESRAIAYSVLKNELPSENAVVANPPYLPEDLPIASGEEANERLPVVTTPVEEQRVSILAPEAKTKPTDSSTPLSLSATTILENDLGIPLNEINVNSKTAPQINILAESNKALQIREILPTQTEANPLASIENLSAIQVPTLPASETTINSPTNPTTNAVAEKGKEMPANKISSLPNPNVALLQDNGLLSSPIATSSGGESSTKEKIPLEIVPVVFMKESGKETVLLLGEQGKTHVGRESVMKKVEEEVGQSPTNIKEGMVKVSLDQPTFHAPTVLEESQMIGNFNATFLPDKASSNAIGIHDVSQPFLIQDETNNAGVRNTNSIQSINGGASLKSSENMKNSGGEDVTINESILAPLTSQAKVGDSQGETVSSAEVNDIVAQPVVDTLPLSHILEVRSPDKESSLNAVSEKTIQTLTEGSQQEVVSETEKLEVAPEIHLEVENKPIPDVSQIVALESVLDADKAQSVNPLKIEKAVVEPTPSTVTILKPEIPAEVVQLKPIKTAEIEQNVLGVSSQPSEKVNGAIEVDQVVKLTTKPDILPDVIDPGVAVADGETIPKHTVATAVVDNSVKDDGLVPTQKITQSDPVTNIAPLQLVSSTHVEGIKEPVVSEENFNLAPVRNVVPINTQVEVKIASEQPPVIESSERVQVLPVQVVPVVASIPETSRPFDTVSHANPEAIENVIPVLSSAPTPDTKDEVISKDVISSVPIALVSDGEEGIIPNLPETDLDSAFGIKPIATTPNLQIPGLKPSIPERPQPQYIDFLSQGVDRESLYFSPPTAPVILPSPPVFSGYSPLAMIQRQQQLMNNYFAGLFYRRALL